VTVLPRSRLKDAEFRRWLQTHEPAWELVWDRPHPPRRGGPRDRWSVCRAPLPSREAWPVIWVRSSLLALRQEQTRRERLAAATDELTDLQRRLRSPKARLRAAHEIDKKIEAILTRHRVARYLTVRRTSRTEHRFRQMRRGRPARTSPTARPHAATRIWSGGSTTRPSPTTARATGCTRCSPTTRP
jgi:hypothetical protein